MNSLMKSTLMMTAMLLFACTQDTDNEVAPTRDNKVGRDYRNYQDDSRQSWTSIESRPLVTTIWYPTVETAQETLWQVDIFKAGWSALSSPVLQAESPYPLIVLSHGTGGSALQLSWLAEYLASNGYIVAGVNHHGNTAAEGELLPQGFALWWERTLDLSAVIDELLSDDQLAKHIDKNRIGLAGFSLGGYTVISAAGGITSLQNRNEFCVANSENPICQLPPEAKITLAQLTGKLESNAQASASLGRASNSYKDSRVKAVYSIAPVHGPAFTTKSLQQIDIPLSLVVGSDDQQALLEHNAHLIAQNVSMAKYEELDDVSHYTFLSRCNNEGRKYVPKLCIDNTSVIRKEVHDSVAEKAHTFFKQHLQ